ncbi:hypothetical protein LX77_01380 [Gelidibacter algens]|uniref:Uncharacterized protein n=1 Tax=Gelidibacter algens TaxID=49280 RepID=A0A1A7R2F0_9FLAO|nr:hypothetical protein [Gelidibacter algens]OBX26440.1 hypothetical protein A9996_05250 [Gelidibacter algens]RAJ25961.1 hypothetical protein LX77_01380 [Gelidibacter algens]
MSNIIVNWIIIVLVILVLFIIIRYLLSKLVYFRNRKKTKNIISILLAVTIYFYFSSLFFYNISLQTEEKFDEIVWINDINDRHKMIDDLLKSNYLIDKSRRKINDVFGKPKKTIQDDIWVYELIDRTWADFELIELKIYFKDDTVRKFDYSAK